ncbi:NACHT domain-containing protein [Streptomyces collinus]|uniref:NACHT domain-containing protein n=1 Tax=Streptomyces collinus TaxID=42684 RepID=UPI003327D497
MDEQLGVVFVHGFKSSAAVWDSFVRLIEDDSDLAFVVPFLFEYDTRLWQPNPSRQIPSFDTTADNLMEYLENTAGDCERLALVAHSQGGLIVQRYLHRMLGYRGRGQDISRRIRRVILFACPNDGAQFGLTLRRILLRKNPQEMQLRPLDEQITDTRAFVLNRVIHAREVSDGSCPISIVVYAGESDNIVTPASARSTFPESFVLPGQHFSIVQPDSYEHRSYKALKLQLLAAADGGARESTQRALDDYCDKIRGRYGFLELAGIPMDSDNLRLGGILLSDVYIQLEALPEIGRTREGPVMVPTDAETSKETRDAVVRQLEWLWQQSRVEKRPQEHASALPPEEAVQSGPPSVVILGVPGAGKSTMMRMLATQMAASKDLIPVYVQLSEAEVTESLSLKEAALNQAAGLYQDAEDRHRIKHALNTAVAENRVCFLFDGLDEVHHQKEKVWAELRAMGTETVDNKECPGARIVVASRPSGYTPLPFAHFRILPLLPEDSQRFIEQWFNVLARTREVTSPELRTQWARDNGAWLTDQLEARPQLRDIASNPLMLTFLTLYAGENPRGRLPEHRKDLYRSYIERLFTGWESRRNRNESTAIERFDDESPASFYTWFIYRVALRVHQGYYGSRPDDSPTEQRLISTLRRDLELFRGVTRHSDALVKEGLDFWIMAGLLRKTEALKGKEWYLFRHQTFQEYGAARALAEQHSDAPDDAWSELMKCRSNPAWAEVIPLTLGCLAEVGHRADSIISTLLREEVSDKSPSVDLEDIYLAARCVSDGAIIDDETLNELLTKLSRRASAGRDEAFSALASIGWIRPSEVLSLLTKIEGVNTDGRTRLRVAEAKGKMQPRSKAITALSELACDDDLDTNFRVTAAWASGRLGYTREAVAWLREIRRAKGTAYFMIDALKEFGTAESIAMLTEIGMDPKVSNFSRSGIAEYMLKAGERELADRVFTSMIDDPSIDKETLISTIGKRAEIRGEIRPRAEGRWFV